MGSLSYMRSFVDRNVDMRRIPVIVKMSISSALSTLAYSLNLISDEVLKLDEHGVRVMFMRFEAFVRLLWW